MKISILGAGTWGVALAALLKNNGHGVRVWSHREEEASALRASNTHINLPGLILPEGIEYTSDIEFCLEGGELVIFVVPSHAMRSSAEILPKLYVQKTISASGLYLRMTFFII